MDTGLRRYDGIWNKRPFCPCVFKIGLLKFVQIKRPFFMGKELQMNMTKEQIDFINENEWLVFATASKSGTPRAIPVIPSLIESGRIIVSDMQMAISAKNIKENEKVFLYSCDKPMEKFIKISGTAEYLEKGELFDEVKSLEAGRCSFIPRGIIVIQISEIIEGEEK